MSAALTRLLQLASPALPVGAYTYSQGLEWAVEAGWVHDEASAGEWIGSVLHAGVGGNDAPLLAAMMQAWRDDAHAIARALDDEWLATRESMELRAETVQMGYSLRRLIGELGMADPLANDADDPPADRDESSIALLWSWLAVQWHIDVTDALVAWLWSWAENQVLAALKTVPLGQAAGQRLLLALGEQLPAIAVRALALPAAQRGNFAPGFAVACARHETQYTRLFRS